MTSSLYRPEAIAHQQEVKMGDVFHCHTSMLAWVTAFMILLTLTVVIYLCYGEYTRKARAPGFLAPSQGLIKIFTPQRGTVVERRVKEGDHVNQGDVLYVLSAEHSSLENSDSQATAIASISERQDSLLAELEQQDELNQIRWHDMHQQASNLQQELQQLNNEILLQEQRVELAQTTREKYHRLFKRGFVPEVQWREKQEYALAQQASLQNLKRDRTNLLRERNSLTTSIAASRHEFARQRAELDRLISNNEQQLTEYQARRSIVIRAPTSGTVSAVLLHTGQVASLQTPMLSLLPQDSKLEVNLLVPSRAIGFIQPGQAVSLRYQAFPYQRFGLHSGKVTSISRALIKPDEADFPIQLTEPAYRVIVTLSHQTLPAYGREFPLQSGMLLDADIALDRYSLLQWILDPLFSLSGRV